MSTSTRSGAGRFRAPARICSWTVGIFPDNRALIHLAGMLCIEADDGWLVVRRYLSAESISLVLAGRDEHTDNGIKEKVPELQAA
jgi:hypothetical protein